MDGVATGNGLPAPNRDIDITRIDFQSTRVPSDAFGCQQGSARAAEGVEHDATALGAILDGIGDEADRLDGRMDAQVVHAARTKRIDASIFPNVRSRAAVATEFNGVEVGGFPNPKHTNEFVLAPVKAALAGIGLHPSNEVKHRAIGDTAGFHQFADMAPVHADKMHGAVGGGTCCQREGLREKARKDRRGHLA